MASYVYKNALKRKMVYEAAHPVVEEYYAGLKEQGSFMERWQYFSPSLMLSNLIEASAENRLVDVTAFQQEADAARAEWHTIFEPKIFKDEPLSEAEVEALPSFEYEKRVSFGFGLWVVLGLIGVNLLVFCGVVVIGP